MLFNLEYHFKGKDIDYKISNIINNTQLFEDDINNVFDYRQLNKFNLNYDNNLIYNADYNNNSRYNEVIISLGSNIGNRELYILKALYFLSSISHITKISHLYNTEPVGCDGGDFLNLSLRLYIHISPIALLSVCQSIERNMGRCNKNDNKPRIIDIDIIDYNDQIVNSNTLTLPHDAWYKRHFVLQTLYDISIYRLNDQNIFCLLDSDIRLQKISLYKTRKKFINDIDINLINRL